MNAFAQDLNRNGVHMFGRLMKSGDQGLPRTLERLCDSDTKRKQPTARLRADPSIGAGHSRSAGDSAPGGTGQRTHGSSCHQGRRGARSAGGKAAAARRVAAVQRDEVAPDLCSVHMASRRSGRDEPMVASIGGGCAAAAQAVRGHHGRQHLLRFYGRRLGISFAIRIRGCLAGRCCSGMLDATS